MRLVGCNGKKSETEYIDLANTAVTHKDLKNLLSMRNMHSISVMSIPSESLLPQLKLCHQYYYLSADLFFFFFFFWKCNDVDFLPAILTDKDADLDMVRILPVQKKEEPASCHISGKLLQLCHFLET